MVEKELVRARMTREAAYLIDIAYDLGASLGIDPVLILAITKHESGWGSALTPPGPGGTGDFIPRKLTPDLKRALDQDPSFKYTTFKKGAVTMVKPTSRGWGHGLYQIDFKSHIPFIATGKWADPRSAMEYSMTNVLKVNNAQIKKAFPGMGAEDLIYATVASYNAGAGGVIGALRSGRSVRSLDQKAPKTITFSPNYVVNILRTAGELRAPGAV